MHRFERSKVSGFVTICRGEDGSILAISMFLLVLLTVIGFAATTTTTIEQMVAGNERIYRENFYRAEAASMTGAQMLENETDSVVLQNLGYPWLVSAVPVPDAFGAPVSDNNWPPTNNGSGQGVDADSRFWAVYEGIAVGSSMGMSGSGGTVHQYSLYGRSIHKGGLALLQVGYRKRF